MAASEGRERNRPVALDNRELEAAIGNGRRVQRRGQRQEGFVEILIIFADADREIVKVRKQARWEIHTRSEEADPPADRVCMNWLSKSPKPLAAAARTGVI